MMTGDEDPTFFRPTIRTLPLFKPAFDQQGLHRPPSPDIGPSIKRIAQNISDQALRGDFPDQPRAADRVRWELIIVITKPLKCFSNAPYVSKLCEYQPYGFAHSSIRMKHNLTCAISSVSDR